jgi:hypothetical protein
VYRSVHICICSLVDKNILYVKPANNFVKFFAIVIKKLFTSKSFTWDAISHNRDYIEGKLVTAVDKLKWPDCGNTTKETEKNAEVDKSDYVDEDTNNLDKLRLSKMKPKSVV